MPKFLISVPFSLHVSIVAENADDINDAMVEDYLIDQHGKYAQIDVRHGGGNWEIIDEEEGG
jgi:hypothetical protein